MCPYCLGFNVHGCCPDKPMARDFLNIIDCLFILCSPCLVPHKKANTHLHILDLVLSHGLPVFNFEICDSLFSDQMPVLLEVALGCNTIKLCAVAPRCRIINPSTAVQFLAVFSQNSDIPESDTEALISWFLNTCQTAIDAEVPLKTRQPKAKSEP